jgi:hypothetical protein
MRLSFGRGRNAALVVGVVLLVGGGVAYATIPDSRGVIHGCHDKINGNLRVIDTERGQVCKRSELPIEWSASAPRLTCPEGTIASTGVCFDGESRAAATHGDAEDDCADEGMRLPGGGELTTFVEIDGVDLERGHWTDDVADTDSAPVFLYFVVADPGNGAAEAFDERPYRCVTGQVLG